MNPKDPSGRPPPPGQPPQGPAPQQPQGQYPQQHPQVQNPYAQQPYPQGQNPPGLQPQSQNPYAQQQQYPQGQYPQGQSSPQAQYPQGQYPQGQSSPPGQYPQGQSPPQSQYPQGQYAQPQQPPYPQGQYPQGQYPQGQHAQPPNPYAQQPYPSAPNAYAQQPYPGQPQMPPPPGAAPYGQQPYSPVPQATALAGVPAAAIDPRLRNAAIGFLVCAGLVLIGLGSYSWFTARGEGGVGLIGIEECRHAICRSQTWFDFKRAPSELQLFSAMGVIGAAVAIGFLIHAAVVLFKGRVKRVKLVWLNVSLGIAAFGCASFFFRLAFDMKGLSLGWAGFPALGGLIAAGVIVQRTIRPLHKAAG